MAGKALRLDGIFYVYDALLHVFNVVLAAVHIVNNGVDVFKLQRGEKRLKGKAVKRLIVDDQNLHLVELAERVGVG